MQKTNIASHAIMASLVLAILVLKLVPAVFVGFLVYTLTHKLSGLFMKCVHHRLTGHARFVALAIVILCVASLLTALGLATFHFVTSQQGLSWLFAKVANILDSLRASLPPVIENHIPATVDELKTSVVELLKANSEKVSAVGMETVKGGAHLLIGLLGGAMVAWARFAEPAAYKPFASALLSRFGHLRASFEKVVFAQVKIALLNATLTAVYLGVALPQFGVHLPMIKALVGITFVTGLLPVVGNLISNSLIVIISLGVSFNVGLASLGFLIAVHKLEYFLNARIIGHDIDAASWELILAMFGMEAVFGLPGLVVAPVLYAYLKRELKEAGLIGRRGLEAVPYDEPEIPVAEVLDLPGNVDKTIAAPVAEAAPAAAEAPAVAAFVNTTAPIAPETPTAESPAEALTVGSEAAPAEEEAAPAPIAESSDDKPANPWARLNPKRH